MGKNQKKLLSFLYRNSGIHTIAKDTLPLARKLAENGLIVLNEYNQAEITNYGKNICQFNGY